MSSIDNAIARIQAIALEMTDVQIKSAPDYPIETIDPLPMATSYLNSGTLYFVNSTLQKNFPTINVEFHFSRLNLRQANEQVNAVAIEFPQRLAGDPTLNGTVITIVGGADSDIPYTVNQYFPWGQPPNIYSVMLKFDIPIKLLKSPQATA